MLVVVRGGGGLQSEVGRAVLVMLVVMLGVMFPWMRSND